MSRKQETHAVNNCLRHRRRATGVRAPAEKPSTGRLVSSASCRRRSSVLDEVVDGADDRDIVDKIVQSARCERQAERLRGSMQERDLMGAYGYIAPTLSPWEPR